MLAQFAPIDFNLLPFSPQEANAIKDWLQKSRAGQQVNGTTVVDRYWREILAAAQLANTCKSFEAIPLKRNRLGQELRRIATARKPKNIPINSAVIAALAFGASRLGLITYPRTTSGFTLRKKLFELSHTQINKSAAQAIKEPLLRGGQPRHRYSLPIKVVGHRKMRLIITLPQSAIFTPKLAERRLP